MQTRYSREAFESMQVNTKNLTVKLNASEKLATDLKKNCILAWQEVCNYKKERVIFIKIKE